MLSLFLFFTGVQESTARTLIIFVLFIIIVIMLYYLFFIIMSSCYLFFNRSAGVYSAHNHQEHECPLRGGLS
jgi:hypothetical protein